MQKQHSIPTTRAAPKPKGCKTANNRGQRQPASCRRLSPTAVHQALPLAAQRARGPNGRPWPPPQRRYLSARPAGGARQRPIVKGRARPRSPPQNTPFTLRRFVRARNCGLGTRGEGNRRTNSVPCFHGTMLLDSFLFFSSSKISLFLGF